MQTVRSNPPVLPLSIAGAAILAAVAVLYLLIGDYGVVIRPDSSSYLAGAWNLAQGHGFARHWYNFSTEEVNYYPLTHHAPFISVVYGAFMALGLDAGTTPALVSLVSWSILLIGIGLLAYRLSASFLAVAVAVSVAAMTHAYLLVFQLAMSEVVFLPLLVWLMVGLVDLPQREGGVYGRLVLVAGLLACLMLTRYVGIFVFGSVLLWWLWCRWQQGELRRGIVESVVLAASAVPLALWLVGNKLLAGRGLEGHLEQDRYTFMDGVAGVAGQLSQILLPAIRPVIWWPIAWGEWQWIRPYFHLPVLAVLLIYLGWQVLRQRKHWLEPTRSPIPLFILAYLGLYIFIQPFAAFFPMDQRDVTTLLCVVQPWLVALVARVPHSRVRYALVGFAVLNLMLLLVSLFPANLPSLITFAPPKVQDLSGQATLRGRYQRLSLVPIWLLITPPRGQTLQQHYSQVVEFLQGLEDAPIIFTNERRFFLTTSEISRVYPIENWLREGSCTPAAPMVVILFDRDAWRNEAQKLFRRVRKQCVGTPYATLNPGIVFRLDSTIEGYEQAARYVRRKEWDKAIEIYNRALAFNPQLVRAYHERGVAYLRINRVRRAVADFGQAIRRMPGWFEPYVYRGRAHLLRRDFARAIADFDQALALRPNRADVLLLRGQGYVRLKQRDRAVADFQRVLEVTTNDKLRRLAQEQLQKLGIDTGL